MLFLILQSLAGMQILLILVVVVLLLVLLIILFLLLRKTCDNKLGFSGKMQRYTHGKGEGNLRSRLQAIKSGNGHHEGVLCHPACSPGSLTATKHEVNILKKETF